MFIPRSGAISLYTEKKPHKMLNKSALAARKGVCVDNLPKNNLPTPQSLLCLVRIGIFTELDNLIKIEILFYCSSLIVGNKLTSMHGFSMMKIFANKCKTLEFL